MKILLLDHRSLPAARAFFAVLAEEDLTFVKDDVADESLLQAWAAGLGSGTRWVATDDDAVVGFLTVLPLAQWSQHVSEMRLVVHPGRRRQGLGTELAQRGLLEAVRAGAEKVVVEAIATDTSTIAMFAGLGFQPEAMLIDHIRDRDGACQDLIILAHHVGDVSAGIDSLGLADTLS